MDTKLNGFKYSYGAKILALVLACLCVLSSAWYCVEIAAMLHKYGWENLLVRKDAPFTDTAIFSSEVANAVRQVKDGALAGTWEEYVAEHYLPCEEEQTKALEKFRAFKQDLDKRMAREGGTTPNVTDANGENTEYETTAYAYGYTNPYAPLSDADYQMEYSLYNERGSFSLYYYMTEEEVLDTVKDRYDNYLAADRRTFISRTQIANAELQKYINFRFLAVNRKTGEVVTNCPSRVQTPNDFYQQYAGTDAWVLGYSATDGLTHYSDTVKIDKLYDSVIREAGYKALPTFLEDNFAKGTETWDFYCGVNEQLVGDDAFSKAATDFYMNTSRLGVLLLAAMLLLGAALLLSIYLILVSGRIRGKEGVQRSSLDKIPTDLHFILSWGISVFGFYFAFLLAESYVFYDETSFYIRNISLLCLGAGLVCAAVYLLLIEWATSTAKNTKAGKSFFRSMLISKFFVWCKVKCCAVKKTLTFKVKRLPKKAWLFVLLYTALNVVISFFGLANWFISFVCIAFVNIAALVLIWRYVRALDDIVVAAEKIKSGETPEPFYEQSMPEPLKSLALNLTYTQEEMQKAVQEAVKGERMKTELITNVSHDLKTPLTSIISYVDLLKKCEIDDADAQKYISVLDEKSIRLKRLIEDLVEASKASSGTVTLNNTHVNLYELAVQAVGEMEDGFFEKGLEIVLNQPEEPPVVWADSQKTWRIMDNLLSNARKYSLTGSRVYIDVQKIDKTGVFTIKNTSLKPLNIDPEELTQRFVRGDESRTLEGSGLGLSIAKDLCRLQGGALKLEIDGDLFKATVILPLSQLRGETESRA